MTHCDCWWDDEVCCWCGYNGYEETCDSDGDCIYYDNDWKA